jgi:hypothetical protein
MEQCIACSCVTCPGCGAWIVVRGRSARGINDEKMPLNTTCTVPECAKEFSFVADDTQIFELPVSLFERRHFYRSELLPSA